jgi:uncharacterized Zn finger protein
MNEEVNIKVTQATQEDEINRLKNELAESAKTIRELSAQLGQAKSNNNLDINAVIRNVVREEMQEIDIWSYESDIEDMARQVLDVDDIAYDVSQNFDIYDHTDTIEEIAKQMIANTDFEVSIKD